MDRSTSISRLGRQNNDQLSHVTTVVAGPCTQITEAVPRKPDGFLALRTQVFAMLLGVMRPIWSSAVVAS